jgi:hypothetical protein
MIVLWTTLLLAIWVALVAWTYLKRSLEYAIASELYWRRLAANSRRLLSDDDLPDEIAEMVHSLMLVAGSGFMTTTVLKDAVRGRLGIPEPKSSRLLESLSPRQRSEFVHVVADALLYDSLQVPLRGFLFRRFLGWLVIISDRPESTADPAQVTPVLSSAKTAVVRQLRSRPALRAA